MLVACSGRQSLHTTRSFGGLAEVRIAVFSVTSPTLTPLAPGLGVSALYS